LNQSTPLEVPALFFPLVSKKKKKNNNKKKQQQQAFQGLFLSSF
jgi:hypothetical protein